MNDQQSTLEKIAASQGFKAFMKKLAIFAGIVTVVGLVMKLCGMQESEMLLVTGMSTLALVAFFCSWIPSPYEGFRGVWAFTMKVTGISLAVTIFGLLCLIMHWPGANLMLIVGISLLILDIPVLIWLFRLIKNHKNEHTEKDE